MRMAEAHWAAAAHWGAALSYLTWKELSQARRDAQYDAMYAALEVLREPTPEMWSACVYGDEWHSMINKLLEVK